VAVLDSAARKIVGWLPARAVGLSPLWIALQRKVDVRVSMLDATFWFFASVFVASVESVL